MSNVDEPRSSLTLTEIDTADGFMRRTVHLTIDHRLVVEGHDLGDTEYEFERTLSVPETRRLAELLAVPVLELLPAIERRFGTTHALEIFVEEQGIAGELWTRTGD
ncbi:MAG TPA: hypothetical protein VFO49_16055 [Nocardioides sp.]|nr:hypothetical protein [Nocardioides sp.]